MMGTIRGVGAETGGVMLIITGLAFAVERFASIDGVWRWLPLLVVYLGARDLWNPAPGAPPRTVPVLVGIWLLISTIQFLGFDFLNSWPLLLVLVGLGLVVDGILEGNRSERQLSHRE